MQLLKIISSVISGIVLFCYSSQMLYFIASLIKKIRKKDNDGRK